MKEESAEDKTNSDVVAPVERLVIRKIKQTCSAFPSQWVATLDDGRMLYFRYRWGYLGIEVSDEPTENVMDAVGGNEVFGESIGDGLDGIIELGEVKKLTSHLIDYDDGV